MNSRLLILGLHRVGFPPHNAKIRGLFITPRLLSFQILLLKLLGYRFLTLQQSMSTRDCRTAVITFDDGYADNVTAALPVLKKHRVPATLFIVTSDIGKENVVWEEAGEDLPADILSWGSLAELRHHGWEIASHAHEHVHLARYEEKRQEDLILRSINEIEERTGERPVSFAYPYGSYDLRTKRVLKRLGIQFAVTTNPSRFEDDLSARDCLELTRLSLGGRHFYHYIKAFVRTMKVAIAPRPLRVFASPSDLSTIAE